MKSGGKGFHELDEKEYSKDDGDDQAFPVSKDQLGGSIGTKSKKSKGSALISPRSDEGSN